MRELSAWAEDSGQQLATDDLLLRAYAQEAARLGTELSTRLRASQEAARITHPEGDQGYRPVPPGGPAGDTGSGSGPTAKGGGAAGGARPAVDEAPTTTGGGPTAGGPTATPAGPAGAESTVGMGRNSRPLELLEAYQASLGSGRNVSRLTDWFQYVAAWTRDTGGFGTPPPHGYRTSQGAEVLFTEGGRLIEQADAVLSPEQFPVPRTRAEWTVAQRATRGTADVAAARRAAAAAIEALRAETAGGANDPASNPSGPGEGPSLSTEGLGDPRRQSGNGPVEIELPGSTVITGGRRPFTAADAEGVARNARRDRPYDEVGVLQNLDTGEYAVIQGNNVRSGGDALAGTMAELAAERPGRWIFVDHSHPIDPQTGVTARHERLPSGDRGDFSYLARRAVANGRALEATLTYTDRTGTQRLKYGVDESGTRVWVEGPGVPRQEFPSLRAYGDWYERQFGIRPDGYGRAPAGEGTPTTTGQPPAPPVLSDALRARIVELRRRIDEHGAVRGQAREAERWRRAIDNIVARTNVTEADVETMIASAEEGLGGRRPLAGGPAVVVDPRDPAVRASLREELTNATLEGNPHWQAYLEVVLAAYERMGALEVGRSARTTDPGNVAGTALMRVRFLRALENGLLHPAAAQIFIDHIQWARRSAGSEQAAVDRGDLVWLDPRTGERLDAHRAGAVVWPSDISWGVWWVDHIVELQHGGSDDPSNYLPMTQTMHSLKSAAMMRWSARYAAARAQAQAEGEHRELVGVP